MNRTDLWLLAILQAQMADDYLVAMTIDEIMEAGGEGLARITVYKHMKKLLKYDYVKSGAKADRSESFYITEKGLLVLNPESEVI